MGQAQTSQVHIADATYPVIFADTNLSSLVKQRIAADLTVCFSPATSFDDAMGRGGDEVEAAAPLPGGNTAITTQNGADYWEGAYKPYDFAGMLPDEMRKNIFLVDYNNQKSVRVTAAASSNYLNAFTLVDTHSNTVQKLHVFLATLKNTDWSQQPLQAMKDLLHLTPQEREQLSADDYRDFAEAVKQNATLGVTVLQFSWATRPEAGGKKVLVYGPVTLFYEGRWGIVNFWDKLP